MGTVYRRKVTFCTTCDRRLDTTAAWKACRAAGHALETRAQSIWWIKYQLGGRPQCVSSGSEKKEDAKKLLREREHLVDKGSAFSRAPRPRLRSTPRSAPGSDRCAASGSSGRADRWCNGTRSEEVV